MAIVPTIPAPLAFDWDEGNNAKNELKHNVRRHESEEMFLSNPLVVYDEEHSQKEERYAAYGETLMGRLLSIIFTLRNDKIRVISARDQDKQERRIYEQYRQTI